MTTHMSTPCPPTHNHYHTQVDLSSALECLNKGATSQAQQDSSSMYAMAALAMAGLVCSSLMQDHKPC